jgi:allantoinase
MFAIQSQRVALGDQIQPAAIVIEGEQIIEVASYGQRDAIDVGNAVILPGLVDPHVHLNEPGRIEWEGMLTGTAAAAAGGITTLCDMPLNSSPVTTSRKAFDLKREAATGKLSMDIGFHGGLVPDNIDQIESLIDAGVLGIKAFMCHSGIDDFPDIGERELRAIMPLLAKRRIPLLAHAEIAGPISAMENPRRYADYLQSRPPSFEREAIAMLIELARETGCHVHVVHLADADCVPMLKAARAEALPITVETCPHYLVFSAEQIADGATMFKCAPPIRNEANRQALWAALSEGLIDLIASDHSPCPPSMKSLVEGRFDQAWGGISSLQVGLPVIWAEASSRGFGLSDVVRWMSTEPAKLLGLNRSLKVGGRADFIVFDDQQKWVVDGEQLMHRHKVTPYHGCSVLGVVHKTFVRGEMAHVGHGQVITGRERG